jgi:hypothetical protein
MIKYRTTNDTATDYNCLRMSPHFGSFLECTQLDYRQCSGMTIVPTRHPTSDLNHLIN